MPDSYFSELSARLMQSTAFVLRKLPYIPGKLRAARLLNQVLTDHCDVGLARFRTKRGILMRIDLRSKAEWKAYWTGQYDDSVVAVLLDVIRRQGDVIDVGAQVGFYTVAFADALESGKVHAFEPVKANVEQLKQNVRGNSQGPVVNIHPFALGDRARRARIQMEKEGESTTGNAFEVRGKVEEFAEGTETVDYRTLDSVSGIDPTECRLIKVDIEGGEVNFLRGASNFIQKGRPYIYGEFSSFWLNMYGQSFEDVIAMCDNWGYEVFQIRKKAIRKMQSPGRGTENVLLVPEEKKGDLPRLIG